MSQTDLKASAESAQSERRSLLYSIAGVVGALSPGPMAELRRMTHTTPPGPAFWRVMATTLEVLASSDRDETERRWGVLLAARAHLQTLHRSGASLGRALAEAGFSELRFQRLLRAEGTPLLVASLEVARFLTAKATEVDWVNLVDLVLSHDYEDSGEQVRRRIARDYFKTLDAKS